MWPLVMYSILINSYEDRYPVSKQEAAKKAGQLQDVLIVVWELILCCMVLIFAVIKFT